MMAVELWSVGLVLVCALIGALGPIFIKKGTADLKLSNIHKNYNLFLGVFFYGFSLLLFIIALKGGEVSILYPLVSTGYVWVALFSQKYLNESMNRYKWSGIALIMFGVILISVAM